MVLKVIGNFPFNPETGLGGQPVWRFCLLEPGGGETERGFATLDALLAYLRRMEDRGEVRGGRFVDGFSGEQFALPEAQGLLRESTAPAERSRFTVISACDPLNLGGFITPGARTSATAGNRILLQDGVPVARIMGEEIEEFPGISESARREARRRLPVVMRLRRYP